MKKVRLFALLLTLVMASTSLLSGTVAKYSTTDSAQDQATVAKWGVLLSVDGTLFGAHYLDKDGDDLTTDDNQPTVNTAITEDRISVSSTADNKLVAPGTKSDKGLKVSLTGVPEVRVNVKVAIEVKNVFLAEGTYGVMVKNSTVTEENFAAQRDGDGLYTLADGTYTKVTDDYSNTTYFSMKDAATVAAGGYWPVVYNTSDLTPLANTTADSTLAVAPPYLTAVKGTPVTLTDVDEATANGTTYTVDQTYNPNQDLAGLNLDNEQITWAWATEGVNDQADTILGLLASATDGVVTNGTVVGTIVKMGDPNEYAKIAATDYSLDTYFGITFTVTQVD